MPSFLYSSNTSKRALILPMRIRHMDDPLQSCEWSMRSLRTHTHTHTHNTHTHTLTQTHTYIDTHRGAYRIDNIFIHIKTYIYINVYIYTFRSLLWHRSRSKVISVISTRLFYTYIYIYIYTHTYIYIVINVYIRGVLAFLSCWIDLLFVCKKIYN